MKLRALVLALLLAPAAAQAVEEEGVTTAKIVMVRRDPKPNAKLVTQLRANKEVIVDRYQDGWVHVRFDVAFGAEVVKMEGWVEEKFVRSKSRHGFFFQRGDGEEPEGGGGGDDPPEDGASEGLATGIFFRTGPAVIVSSYSLKSGGTTHSTAARQHVGASVTGTYWASERVGTRVHALAGEATATSEWQPRVARTPMSQETEVRSRLAIAGLDVVVRRGFGPLVVEGAAGVETIDMETNRTRDEIVAHRVTGATLGATASFHAGAVGVHGGGRYWVAPVASESARHPLTGAGPSGFVDGASAFGVEAGLDLRLGRKWQTSVEIRYTQVHTDFRGAGSRFGRTVDGASTDESFLGAGLTLSYAL